MLNYVIRRLLIGLLTLLMITFVIFGLIRNMPGDPLSVELAEMDPSVRINEQDYERMKRAYGLDKPWPQAYLQWVSNLARWDLGRSITYKQSVTKIIGERIGPTLILTGTSLVLAYLLSIPMDVRTNRSLARCCTCFTRFLPMWPRCSCNWCFTPSWVGCR